ncbi:MAG TPA: sn-glycerol-3-phosphate ABC transporter ATP-binding protein UgpC [Atopostipes sp.]|nr:sn-glycerol-3-phosphate ABC transporter ATP-binding protein UgpC [Atopostipes sp.]
MAKVNMQNMSKVYEGADDYAVENFNLEIDDHEFIVFVGPSGCGKTTTLRMVAGLEEITEGELYIDGDLMNDVEPKERDIAMVFQNYALYPHMTVFDNMAFGLKLRKVNKKEIKERVENAAELLGLSDFLDRKPAALSGGQRQRVALGRAVVRDPKLFLMDEPLSNLDAKLRVKMRTEIAKLHEELGSTTIYVTHDQTEAMTLATRIVIMNEGVIQQVGSPYDVYHSPNNLFVASFIGSPAMNFYDVTYSNGEITDNNGLIFPVNEENKKYLEEMGYENKEIVFGIRPEDIEEYDEHSDIPADVAIPAKIIVSELMGKEANLYLDVGGNEVVAIVDAEDYHQAGTEVKIVINMDKAHFFDKETGKAIKKQADKVTVEN